MIKLLRNPNIINIKRHSSQINKYLTLNINITNLLSSNFHKYLSHKQITTFTSDNIYKNKTTK